MRLEVVADVNIPYIKQAFESFGSVRVMPAEAITRSVCTTADLVLVRSVTQVNEALLAGSQVQFVGSATAGADHIDTEYLADRGIAFANAPGSNAGSVVEYVLTALLSLSTRYGRTLNGRTLGAIGCGHIGEQVASRARALGLSVLRNDPPREARGETGFVSLAQVLSAADIITLHVPLATDTRYLINDVTLSQLRPGAWLINTSRGAVVETQAIKQAIKSGHLEAVVLDVWEHEPSIDLELLEMVSLATPHIAGYSLDGKVAGTVMLYDAAVKHFGLEARWCATSVLKPASEAPLLAPDRTLPQELWLSTLAHNAYNLDADDRTLRRILSVPSTGRAQYFRQLRATYPARRAFDTFTVQNVPPSRAQAVRAGLGMRIIQ